MFAFFSVIDWRGNSSRRCHVACLTALRRIWQQREASLSIIVQTSNARTATRDFCRACLLNEHENLVQRFWSCSVSLPEIIVNIKIDCGKKFTAVVVPWHKLYNQEVHWNHRFVKLVLYNKRLIESAQLEKNWMDFYGASLKCRVTCW